MHELPGVCVATKTRSRQSGPRHNRAETIRQLRASEELYRNLFENANDGIATFTLEGIVTNVNGKTKRMLGWSREEIIGQPYQKFLSPASAAYSDERTRRALAKEELPSIFEVEFIGKDGSMIPAECRTRFIRDADGNPIGIQGIYRDITERKRAEEALRASEKRFRALIENSSDAIALTTADGTLLYVSPADSHLSGRSWGENVGHKMFEFVHPDDMASTTNVLTQLLQWPDTPIPAQFRYQHKDGSWRWVEAVGQNLLAEPSVRAIVVNYRDISKRKQVEDALRRSEERYRSLTVATAQIVWTADPRGQLAGDVSLWIAFTGQRAEEITGEGWANALQPEDRQRVLDTWSQAVATRSVYTTVYRLRRYDGEYRYVGVRAVPVLEKDGQVREWVGTCSDITERKQAEEQLRDYAERLQSLSRRLLEVQESERRTLALELHDELGQVLTGLRLTLEASLHLPPQTARQQVEAALTLANEMIGQVRELALDLRPAVLDDLGLVPALEWLCKRYTVRTQVTATFEQKGLDRRFAPEVETAAYRIMQEALTNVARHAGVSKARVWLGADQDQLTVEIHDQGRGFEPDTVLAAGAGSGLVGMRERAALLGGQLTVESAPGQGTRIRAHLPLPAE